MTANPLANLPVHVELPPEDIDPHGMLQARGATPISSNPSPCPGRGRRMRAAHVFAG
jgi:hypothetical protein